MAKLLIDKNRQNISPTLLLKRRNLDTIGIIPCVSDVNLSVNFSSADELSFTVYKYLDGKINTLWDDIESLKVVYLQEQDENFEISVTTVDNEGTVKKVTGKSLCESELSNVTLYDIEINTQKDSDNEDYTKASQFCDFTDTKHSIVHRVLDKVPHYKVGHVDESLANMVREFSINGTSIYSFLTGDFSEQFGCICLFDSTSRTINFYDLENRCNNSSCTSRTKRIGTSTYCPYCGGTNISYGYGKDTTIFVTNENIAQEISMESQTDSLKNCFRVSGGDDDMTAAMMNINPNGSQYIYYFNDSQLADMPTDLRNKLTDYQNLYNEYMNTHRYNIISLNLLKYNLVLVRKYHPTDYSDYVVPDLIYGYESLTNYLYLLSDMYSYLKTTMMPTTSYTATTAQQEVNKLTASALGSIGVSSLSNLVVSSVSRSILDYANIFINTGRYKLSINESEEGYPKIENRKWIGSFVCKSRTDESDSATSPHITLQLTADQETFLKQKIQKQLDEYDIRDSDTEPDTNGYWTKYCLDSLNNYKLAYEGVVSVLQTSTNSIAETVRNEFLTKFKTRLEKINDEIVVRNDELTLTNSIYEDVYTHRIETHEELDFQEYLGSSLLKEFYAYRREDDYTNSNYISDGYTSSELINAARELLDDAKRNLIQAATLQHTMSVSMNDLLTIPEFEPLWSDFEVGNWIRVRVNDEIIKLRLIKYDINFEDVSTLNVEFSDVLTSLSSTSDIQSILSKAQSVSGKFDYVEQQASSMYKNKSYFDDWFINGLDASKTKIVDNAKNQNIVFDANGILCREYDPYDQTYDSCQMRIINQGLYLTDNNWSSLVTAIGKYIYDDSNGNQIVTYGVNGQTIVGKLLIGENLVINNENNNFTIDENGMQISNSISKIVINPNAENGNIFQVLKNNEAQLYIDQNGNIKINGAIINLSDAYIPVTESGTSTNYSLTNYIEAKTISVANLDANMANIIDANIENATIQKLNAKYANIQYIDSNFINVSNLSAEVAKIGTLDADSAFITYLKANVVDADTIKANVAEIGYLTADSAVITSLQTNKLDTNMLSAEVAKINNLDANSAFITYLKSDVINANTIKAAVADIGYLTADSAVIKGKLDTNSLSAEVAKITSLEADSAFVTLLNSISSTAVTSTVNTEFVKDLIVGHATINDLFTSNFTVGSDDNGSVVIDGSTMQFKDSGGNVYIQLGTDSEGGHSLILKDANGDVLLNGNGITKDAITDGLIVNEMLKQKDTNYNGISGDRLNIDSVITSINGSTTTIKSTQIYFDEDKQTLNTKLSSMTTSINSVNDKLLYEVVITSSNGTTVDTSTTLTATVYYYGTNTPVPETSTDTDSVTFTYQWYKNGTEIANANEKTYEVTMGTDNMAQYSCKVSY